jgi:crotonobetainyl-CoA:carnitine CoA-transferase CaiB-like acyl-CoA transferase
LAFLGAEVIKVESRASIDAWRGPLEGGDVRRYPGLVRGARPYDRSATFNSQNTDKRSVELDLKSADGLTAMRHLVERSDVLICNIAPGALTRLGLDYPGLVKLNAGLVLLEITGFGASGAMSRHVAVGPTVEASAGMMTLLGYGDGIPQNTGGAYLDPVAALVGTGAVLSALAGRAGSGHGAHIELSLRELALSWIGEYLVESLATGRKAPALGNRAPDAAPHGVYRCAGDDEWIGIAVTNDAQWQALCGVLGRIDLAEDPLLMTASGRHAEHERIDAEIRSWCLGRDKHLAADQLQAAGIAAAGLATGADLASDPHLIARGFLHELHHPAVPTARLARIGLPGSANPGTGQRLRAAGSAGSAPVALSPRSGSPTGDADEPLRSLRSCHSQRVAVTTHR